MKDKKRCDYCGVMLTESTVSKGDQVFCDVLCRAAAKAKPPVMFAGVPTEADGTPITKD